MGVDVQGEYPRDVLSGQGSGPPHEAWQRHRQHGVGKFGHAEPDPARLRHDEGRHPKLLWWASTDARGEGHQSKRGGAWTDLDAPHSLDPARRGRQKLRKTGADEA